MLNNFNSSKVLCAAAAFVSLSLASCKSEPAVQQQGTYIPPAPVLSFGLEKQYPHDTTSFTEGLFIHNGSLFESTGSPESLPNTRSIFGTVNLENGSINVKGEIDRELFGEGITILNNKLYQLTYRSRKGFIYDASSFKKAGEFTITSPEGWGMTTDSSELIMTDGSSRVSWLNPSNFRVSRSIDVTENGIPVMYLNELEYVNGFLYINVFGTNTIIKVDPKDGKVLAKLDLFALADDARRTNPNSLEMNGIAWNPTTNRFLITGKFWPKIYEINILQ